MADPIFSQNTVRPSGILTEVTPPLSDIAYIYFDSVYSWTLYSRGGGTGAAIGPFDNPSGATISVEMKGSKFPTTLRSVDTNISTLASTTTDHDMGASAPSVSITYAAGHEVYLTFKRRF